MKDYKQKCYDGIYPRLLVTEKFIEDNNFKLGRSSEEIKMKAKTADYFGNELEVLVDYLPWEEAKDFYDDDFVKKVETAEVSEPQRITEVAEAVQDMLDYLNFGLGKALDQRGLSASRTVSKLGTWFWLLGREDLEKIISDPDLYNPYGMPSLIEVSEKLGLPVSDECREFAGKKC